MKNPLVSVIIVAYNSKSDLPKCLASLEDVSEILEIIIVDNGSTDGTVEWLKKEYSTIKVLEAGYNAGYAEGNNIGVSVANGDYFFILNPDTRVAPGAVETMLELCTNNPGAVVTPKILQPDGTVNACGTSMHFSGITTCNGIGQSPHAYHGTFRTLLVSGAAFMLSRAVWDDVGGFDPSFFMYMEDVDISVRFWLYGHSVVCAADAIVYHDYRLNLSSRKFYYLERNRLLVLAKLYEWSTVRRLWAGLLVTEGVTLAYAVRRGPQFFWARLKGYAWIVAHVREIKRGRGKVQRERVLSDRGLLALMRPYLPYQDLTTPRLANVLSLVTTPIFRTVHRLAVHM